MKVLSISEEQRELQSECELIKTQLITIDKTIKVLKDINRMKGIVRESCAEDIKGLMNWIYS